MVRGDQIGPLVRQVLEAVDPDAGTCPRKSQRLTRRTGRAQGAHGRAARLPASAPARASSSAESRRMRRRSPAASLRPPATGRASVVMRATASSLRRTPKRSSSSIVRLIQSNEVEAEIELRAGVEGSAWPAKRSSSQGQTVGGLAARAAPDRAPSQPPPAARGRPAPAFAWSKISGSSCRRSLPIWVRGSGSARDREIADARHRTAAAARAARPRAREMLLQLSPVGLRALRFGSGTNRPTSRPSCSSTASSWTWAARAVDRLDVLGEDVLAAGENDQLLAAADDVADSRRRRRRPRSPVRKKPSSVNASWSPRDCASSRRTRSGPWPGSRRWPGCASSACGSSAARRPRPADRRFRCARGPAD